MGFAALNFLLPIFGIGAGTAAGGLAAFAAAGTAAVPVLLTIAAVALAISVAIMAVVMAIAFLTGRWGEFTAGIGNVVGALKGGATAFKETDFSLNGGGGLDPLAHLRSHRGAHHGWELDVIRWHTTAHQRS